MNGCEVRVVQTMEAGEREWNSAAWGTTDNTRTLNTAGGGRASPVAGTAFALMCRRLDRNAGRNAAALRNAGTRVTLCSAPARLTAVARLVTPRRVTLTGA